MCDFTLSFLIARKDSMISASRVGPASATCQTHTNRKDHEISPGYSRIKSDSLVSFLGDFSFSVGVLCVNLSWYAFHSRGDSGNDDSNTFWFSPTPEIIHRPIFSRLMAYAAYDMSSILNTSVFVTLTQFVTVRVNSRNYRGSGTRPILFMASDIRNGQSCTQKSI